MSVLEPDFHFYCFIWALNKTKPPLLKTTVMMFQRILIHHRYEPCCLCLCWTFQPISWQFTSDKWNFDATWHSNWIWYKYSRVILRLWSGPDLNPVENVWGILERWAVTGSQWIYVNSTISAKQWAQIRHQYLHQKPVMATKDLWFLS